MVKFKILPGEVEEARRVKAAAPDWVGAMTVAPAMLTLLFKLVAPVVVMAILEARSEPVMVPSKISPVTMEEDRFNLE